MTNSASNIPSEALPTQTTQKTVTAQNKAGSGPHPLAAEMKKTNVYLVGMMGAGKTTIGRKLANRLGYRFLDTDALIEQSTGQTVTDLFAAEGEAGFRAIETQVLSQVSSHTNLVVATGGGIVTQPMNWSYLHHGVVLWLDVPVSVLVSRLSGDSTRPLLHGVDLHGKLESLLAERGDRYALADIRIGYEGKSVGTTCDRIIAAIEKNLRPDPKLAVDQISINQTSINPVREDAMPEI
ncbi:MAG: shikimate kinase [Cyanobacteria bacterium J06649_4]